MLTGGVCPPFGFPTKLTRYQRAMRLRDRRHKLSQTNLLFGALLDLHLNFGLHAVHDAKLKLSKLE